MVFVHPTWDRLGFRGTDDLGKENKQSYSARIRAEFPCIPGSVLEQWLYLHHRNAEMRRLYGWINFSETRFSLIGWDIEQIAELKAFKKFEPYVEMTRRKVENAASLIRIEKRSQVRGHWLGAGTWRTPIVVLRTENAPPSLALETPHQLIEGHTRLGWFRAFNSSLATERPQHLAHIHYLWLVTVTSDNSENS